MAKEYTSINLPTTLVEELKVWKMAFEFSYGKSISYEFMIRGMLDALEETDPGVVEALGQMVQRNPALMDKIGKYSPDQDK